MWRSLILLTHLAAAGQAYAETLAPGHWPTLPEVIARNKIVDDLLQDPTSGFGAAYWEFSEADGTLVDVRGDAVERWSHKFGKATYAFLAGDFAAFDERLETLEKASFNDDDYGPLPQNIRRYRAQDLADLYAWSIESALHEVSVARFRAILSRLQLDADAVPDWHRVSLAFLEGDDEVLANIAQSAESTFVKAYSCLRLSQLNNDLETLSHAIERFAGAYDSVSAPRPDQRRGRIALHLSRALLLMHELVGSAQPLAAARSYADAAIANLSLLEMPVLWASSQRLSSEIYEAEREQLGEPDSEADAILAAKAARSYELSLL